MSQIEVRGAVKVFRSVVKEEGISGALKAFFKAETREIRAVDRLDFTVEAGDIVGYIGANGAGKSTTVKLLSGIMEPSSGEIRVLGRDPCRERVANAREIGVVFGQKTQLWWDLPAIESYHLLQKIYEVPEQQYRSNLAMMTEVLGLEELLRKPVRQMSLGQRMRCDLVAPFLHDPRIVYLDEPTIGLDVSVKATIRRFLKEHCRARGITLFLTTHDLRDIEEVATRVVLIDRGRKLFDGSVHGLRRTCGERRRLFLELQRPFAAEALAAEFPSEATGLEFSVEGLTASISFDPDRLSTTALVEHCLRHNTVVDFTLEDVPIEEIVRRVYEGELGASI